MNPYSTGLNTPDLTKSNGRLSPEKVERLLTAEEPLSQGYRPNAPALAFWADNYTPLVRVLYDIEAMLADSHVSLPLSYYKSGISHVEVEIKASSPEVEQFAHDEWVKFWERCLEAVQNGYDYGWVGCEIMYESKDGKLGLDRLESFVPFDSTVVTINRKFAGVRIKNVVGAKGPVDLWTAKPGLPAKGFWYSHHPRFNRHYGRTQLYAAWRPWRRLSGRDACEDIMDAAVYRLGYQGPVGRFPGEDAQSQITGTVKQSLRSKMLEMCENAKAGMSVAFSSRRDEHGQFVYDLQWPEHTINVSGLIEYGKYLQDQISWGIGTPPELISASEVGSGYSGRAIPMEGFFTGQHHDARAVTRAWKDQIGDPLVAWNHGEDAWFTIKVKPILESKIRAAQALSQPPQPPGGQPGMPPGMPGQPPTPGQAGQGQLPGQQAQQAGQGAENPLAALLGGGGGTEPQKPLRFALGDPWEQYIGPHGGRGWKDRATGRIIYGGKAPGAGERGYASHAEAMSHQATDSQGLVENELRWGNILSNEATHVMLVGPTSSGKSTVAQALAASTEGDLFIIDPVWRPGNWGGLPAITVSRDGDYEPIAQAIDGLLNEMKSRGAQLQDGVTNFPRLTIVWDEVPDTVAELSQAGVLIRRLAQRGRHENMHLIGIGQSSRVNSWGIAGYGDVFENFAVVSLGQKAYEEMPELVGTVDRPGVLEWHGKKYAIDMSQISDLAKRPIDPSRLFHLNAAEMSLGGPEAEDAWLDEWTSATNPASRFLGIFEGEGHCLSLWSGVQLELVGWITYTASDGSIRQKRKGPSGKWIYRNQKSSGSEMQAQPGAEAPAEPRGGRMPEALPADAVIPGPRMPQGAPGQPAAPKQKAAGRPAAAPQERPATSAVGDKEILDAQAVPESTPTGLPLAKPEEIGAVVGAAKKPEATERTKNLGGLANHEIKAKFGTMNGKQKVQFKQAVEGLNALNADKSHPIFKFKSQAGVIRPQGGLPEVRTIRPTAQNPMSGDEHKKMSQMHVQAAHALHMLGQENLAKSHMVAARYHNEASQGKHVPKAAEAVGLAKKPTWGDHFQSLAGRGHDIDKVRQEYTKAKEKYQRANLSGKTLTNAIKGDLDKQFPAKSVAAAPPKPAVPTYGIKGEKPPAAPVAAQPATAPPKPKRATDEELKGQLKQHIDNLVSRGHNRKEVEDASNASMRRHFSHGQKHEALHGKVKEDLDKAFSGKPKQQSKTAKEVLESYKKPQAVAPASQTPAPAQKPAAATAAPKKPLKQHLTEQAGIRGHKGKMARKRIALAVRDLRKIGFHDDERSINKILDDRFPDKRRGGKAAGILAKYKQQAKEKPQRLSLSVSATDDTVIWLEPETEENLDSLQLNLGPHEFASTQVQVPAGLAAKVRAFSESIPAADLADKGCETDCHITILCGIETNGSREMACNGPP